MKFRTVISALMVLGLWACQDEVTPEVEAPAVSDLAVKEVTASGVTLSGTASEDVAYVKISYSRGEGEQSDVE